MELNYLLHTLVYISIKSTSKMPSKVTIAKLVKTSLSRNTPKKIFLSLLLQTLLADSIADTELLDGLIELDNKAYLGPDTSNAQVELALEFCGSSSENAKTFFCLLPRLTIQTQLKYLTGIKNSYKFLFKEAILEEFVKLLLPSYTSEVEKLFTSSAVGSSHHVKSLWSRLMFLWRSVAESHPSLATGVIDTEGLLKCSQQANFSLEYTKRTIALISSEDRSEGFQIIPDIKSGVTGAAYNAESTYSLNCYSKKYASYLKLKKIAWLTTRFRTWNFNDLLLEKYSSTFKMMTQNPTDVIEEFIDIFFTGFLLAAELSEEPYILFNWKNFIVSRFANALKNFRSLQIGGITEDTGDHLISKTMAFTMPKITQTRVGGAKAPYDLRKKFLKSCIYSRIITLEQYGSAFSEDARAMSLSLITHEVDQLSHVDQITHAFNSKLAKVNVEFTSFEESKLIDYFQSLLESNFEYSEDKQVRLADLVGELLESAIKEKNNEKLSRLLLGFLNSISTANFVFFCSNKGPWLVLELLVQYIDGESFSVDDDDSNFQDLYSSFGIMLSSIISIVCFFGVDFSNMTIKLSYCVDYINKFFFRLADTLTSSVTDNDEDDKTIGSNYETLLADWIACLFDVNNEGLSDELLKSVNVKQIYKFMFIIFQQAISARTLNVLNSASINNGIDYLSQNFLAPCSIEIIKWMATKIGGTQTHSEAFIEIIWKIIESNMGSDQASNMNGPNFTFKMILNIVAPFIFDALKGSRKTGGPMANKILKFLKSTVDSEYCLPYFDAQINEFDIYEARSPLKVIKAELALIIKSPLIETQQLSKSWAKIKRCLKNTAPHDLADSILEEIGRCGRAPGQAQSEDSRLFVDGLIYILVMESFAIADNVLSLTFDSNRAKEPSCITTNLRNLDFNLSMDHHYSSIFNEGIPSNSPTIDSVPDIKEEIESKHDLMGFDTDDLFNDMPQDLFEDIVPAGTAHSTLPHPVSGLSGLTISIYQSYLYSHQTHTALNLVVLQFDVLGKSDAFWNRVTGIAIAKINQELSSFVKAF